VWDYVVDIRNWADLMPGLQNCEIIDDDNSRWVLKVGVGGMVRTVKVAVHVEEWAGPGLARFAFKLEGDPVHGGGTYTAAQSGDGTDFTLAIQVVGSGPVAPMWEALGRPVLPTFVKAFAEKLKGKIEENAGSDAVAGSAPAAKPPLLVRLGNWLRSLFG
jgi:carbon monoxide dehydrogenase subunit G